MQKGFYDAVRSTLFDGTFDQSQFLGMEAIGVALDTFGDHDRRNEAYVFATAFHETGRKMQPVYEIGPHSYFNKYEPGTNIGRMLGNVRPGDGFLFRGRGLVQLTGRAIYARAGVYTHLPLETNPDMAMLPDVAARLLVLGVEGGWFTGRGIKSLGTNLDDYHRFIEDRRAVNGTDRAAMIANYAMKFEAAIAAS